MSEYPMKRDIMKPMIENVKEGKVSMELIDRAVRRILEQKFRLGLFENPYVDPEYAVKVTHTNESQEVALNVAREGIVLLKNEKNILPLNKNLKKIAIIGPNADNEKISLEIILTGCAAGYCHCPGWH